MLYLGHTHTLTLQLITEAHVMILAMQIAGIEPLNEPHKATMTQKKKWLEFIFCKVIYFVQRDIPGDELGCPDK